MARRIPSSATALRRGKLEERAQSDTPGHQMMYQARMLYVSGHASAESSTQDPSTWTIRTPDHLKPRNRAVVAAASPIRKKYVRPRTAPEGGGERQRRGGSTTVGGRASGSRPGTGGGGERRTMAQVAGQAMWKKAGGGGENDDSMRMRSTIQLNFAKGLGTKLLPLERRLEMKRAEHKMKMMAEMAKAKRRSSYGRNAPLHSWKLSYQAGCWFWVDQVTGVATAAPPPDTKGRLRGNLTSAAAAEMGAPFSRPDDESDGNNDDASDEDCSDDGVGAEPPAVPPCGTGHVVYDSREFVEFMRLLDTEKADKGRRHDLRPTSAPLPLSPQLTKRRLDMADRDRLSKGPAARDLLRNSEPSPSSRKRAVENA